MDSFYRTETDSLGSVEVPDDRYYGAQTARAISNFNIGTEILPPEFFRAYAIIKKAAALTNNKLAKLSDKKRDLIVRACEELIEGRFDTHLPLVIWQSGSGSQTNMNINEVIANRAIEIAGGIKGSKSPVHPNDDVNMSQSTNDTFPSAIHICGVQKLEAELFPAMDILISQLEKKTLEFSDIIKTGRTHLMDATPVTLGQEFSGYAAQLKKCRARLKNSMNDLYELALGGTAVGTGLNSPKEFAVMAAQEIASITGLPFKTNPSKFEALAAHDAIVQMSGTLKTQAVALIKIANDIRWLGSGPRCCIGEIILPDNEPGSSIMPGKINPTQPEAMLMVCAQVIGNDASITVAGSGGNFELNVMKPLIAYNFLQSINILSGAVKSFALNCIAGIKPDHQRISLHLRQSLMLVTALSPKTGYDKAAQIALKAYKEGLTLKEAALALNVMTSEEFDELVKPEKMIG